MFERIRKEFQCLEGYMNSNVWKDKIIIIIIIIIIYTIFIEHLFPMVQKRLINTMFGGI